MNPKLKHISLLAALVCGSAWADDNNVLFLSDAILMPGTSATVELRMRNIATNLTCIEAEIRLPEGLSVACDENGNPDCTLYRNRSEQHEVIANVLENGNLKLLISSVDGAVFSGSEGPLMGFTVQAAEDAPIGECLVETVGESLIVSAEAAAFYSVGVTGNVLITDDPTGINEELRMRNEESDAIYNLSGQRVGKAKNGIFIKGGKKELHR